MGIKMIHVGEKLLPVECQVLSPCFLDHHPASWFSAPPIQVKLPPVYWPHDHITIGYIWLMDPAHKKGAHDKKTMALDQKGYTLLCV